MSFLKDQLITVANALGRELVNDLVFVGGSTVFLYLDDQDSSQLRPTDDVDAIVNVVSRMDWGSLEVRLAAKGFHPSLIEDDPTCRFRSGNLIIDIIPLRGEILGFTNRWYQQAFDRGVLVDLVPGLTVRYVSVEFFIATKLEAYQGRGRNDLLMSHDIEDILTVITGRQGLADEFSEFSNDIRLYIKNAFEELRSHDDFDYLIAGNAQGLKHVEERIKSVFGRILASL